MRCYFNVRSKADMSQLNLPHGNRQVKCGKREKTDMLSSIRRVLGIRGVSSEEEKEGYGGKDLQKRKAMWPELTEHQP